MSNDTPIPDAWIAYCAAFHELFPRSGNVELSAAAIQQFACNIKADFERENARLREEVEMLNVRHAAAMLHAQTHADEYNALREELAEAKELLEHSERNAKFQYELKQQAEARALEYKTEHAALLGTSQWQEVEIADLRDDVKRLHKTVSECEERALAAEKSHMDLIMQVARKWPNESRHETAKRYIMEAENRPWSGPDQAAVGAKHD